MTEQTVEQSEATESTDPAEKKWYVVTTYSNYENKVKVALQEKVRLEIGVSESFVDVTVKAILGAARTGDVGDGKVFVLDVDQVHRIRTGERDEAAVTPPLPVEV